MDSCRNLHRSLTACKQEARPQHPACHAHECSPCPSSWEQTFTCNWLNLPTKRRTDSKMQIARFLASIRIPWVGRVGLGLWHPVVPGDSECCSEKYHSEALAGSSAASTSWQSMPGGNILEVTPPPEQKRTEVIREGKVHRKMTRTVATNGHFLRVEDYLLV